MANVFIRKIRKKRIASYRSSSFAIKDCCAENSVTLDQLKNWHKKEKKKSTTKAASASHSVTDTPSELASSVLWVHVGSARIEVTSGFKPQLLREIVVALSPQA